MMMAAIALTTLVGLALVANALDEDEFSRIIQSRIHLIPRLRLD